MDSFCLNIDANSIGGYFSSEQLDLLSIVQCQTQEELISFVCQCEQLKGEFSIENLQNLATKDLEAAKKEVFEKYQKTFVPHDSKKIDILNNTLKRLGLNQEEIITIKNAYAGRDTRSTTFIREYLKSQYPDSYLDILKQVQRFISLERDQVTAPHLYNEFVLLNERLSTFDTLLIGSGEPETVINPFLEPDNQDHFDFYLAKRGLDFALRNNKHIRFHSLLTRGANESLFVGKTKEEILEILTNYVKASIDFINEYNATHHLADGTPVIQSIDLFNEIVSFDENRQGEYENIWETKYGISIPDLCRVFEYARVHKPEGVSYLYNEPFLENTKRRRKVFEVLQSINSTSNGLIDTLGSQTHITFETEYEKIQECFQDFKFLQDTQGMKIQITEFDLSLSEAETLKTIGKNPQLFYEQKYNEKREKMDGISSIIRSSGVRLSGLSYWSLTDSIDFNLERIRSSLLQKGIITDIEQVPNVCGGMIPTLRNSYLYDAIYSDYDKETYKRL